MYFTDDDAIEHVASGIIDHTLPKSEWTHAGHFAVALWLCRHRPDLAKADAIRTLITQYNEATQTPNTDTSGYHHTITLASMRGAAFCLAGHAETVPLHIVHAALMTSRLGSPDWLLAHWCREILFSVAARQNWVEPDLHPLAF